MKQLPDEKTLLELLEVAKEAEQKMREAGERIEAFSQKWEGRLKDRQAVTQKVGGIE
ncbi:hypothetical protein [Argonema antarcticum]|uniref:hypothetical protein n=1 Tax=Argonema antarcticum TaxID=2942763 RepID=UPI002011980A|nr:hypothetical protein [Argonema antarcticum]MCL1470459.1 hypothetical protein [Argonema antarcticum A004/B2]